MCSVLLDKTAHLLQVTPLKRGMKHRTGNTWVGSSSAGTEVAPEHIQKSNYLAKIMCTNWGRSYFSYARFLNFQPKFSKGTGV